LDRCIAAQTRTDQVLFPIVQGGLDLELREECTKAMVKRVQVGIAVGGLSGGEAKDQFWRVVARCCELIPENIPRYVMGVGWPVDLVIASVLGADMFDCVYPTRTARFGTAITRREGDLHLARHKFKEDFRPIDEECGCFTCKNHTRAFLYASISQVSWEFSRV
jgi:queuine tRNA-ribosyltransferase